jgi:hypothetical protein
MIGKPGGYVYRSVQKVQKSEDQKLQQSGSEEMGRRLSWRRIWRERWRWSRGASRGIGAAIAKRLAQEGAAVAITYASAQQKADEVVKAIAGRWREGAGDSRRIAGMWRR